MNVANIVCEWKAQIEQSLIAFQTVAELGGDPITRDEITVEYLPSPHRPPTLLPEGKLAIYAFWGDGGWLKIGKAGPNSQGRYTYQHYGFNAPRTLAKSLVASQAEHPIPGFDPIAPGNWIKASTHRVNILIPSSRRIELLSLLEAFLHLRLNPRYEGYEAQRPRPASNGVIQP
ncbi:MAG TPA: hypothetical protein VFL82_12070 [Thermomicrobiales bacterium]|nr:hypothetical protein [Thermomicrobiales bacterium]